MRENSLITPNLLSASGIGRREVLLPKTEKKLPCQCATCPTLEACTKNITFFNLKLGLKKLHCCCPSKMLSFSYRVVSSLVREYVLAKSGSISHHPLEASNKMLFTFSVSYLFDPSCLPNPKTEGPLTFKRFDPLSILGGSLLLCPNSN